MQKVRSFEDLLAWQKARLLCTRIYLVTRSAELSRDFGLISQLQRAAVSVMSNIAEGHERVGAPEFIRYLTVAKASCAELRSHLYVAVDVGYLSRDDFDSLMEEAREVSKILSGLRAAIERTKKL